MLRHKVRTVNEALAYITDCNLATVSLMALKKSRPKGEFNRQIDIAQLSIDWMKQMNVDFSLTRAAEIINDFDSSVKAWSEKYISSNND